MSPHDIEIIGPCAVYVTRKICDVIDFGLEAEFSGRSDRSTLCIARSDFVFRIKLPQDR